MKPTNGPPAAITAATAADAEALASLYADALPPGWPAHELAAACGDPNRAVLKAADGADVHGFLILQFAADEAEILGLAVAKDQRRLGHAASLLRQGISLCWSRFVTCIYLEVSESNDPARRLYEKFGFVLTGRRNNYYSSLRSASETAILMKRDQKLPLPVDLEKSCT